MRSASASARATMTWARDCASSALWIRSRLGGAASCSKLKAASAALGDEFILAVASPDHDRLGLLELADLGDDAALGLLDDAAQLRRLVLDLLEQHLGRALRHVGHDLVADLLGHAAKREREVLLVDVLEQDLHAAVVELDDVLEDEEHHPDLLGEIDVGLRELVEHVALGPAVGAVEDVH